MSSRPPTARPQRNAAFVLVAIAAAALAPIRSCGEQAGAVHHAARKAERVVLVTCDVLGRDLLGCYGAPGEPTPHMDAFAASGLALKRSFAPTTDPLAGALCLLTGRLPDGLFNAGIEFSTIADAVANAGTTCAAVVSSPALVERFGEGLATGFDRLNAPAVERDAASTTSAALDLLDRLAAEGRTDDLFLWVHFPGLEIAASPDRPGAAPLADRLTALDRSFGALVQGLAKRDLLQGTLLLLTSATGGRQGPEIPDAMIGARLSAACTRVPLLVHSPSAIEPDQRGAVIGHPDVASTVLDALGVREASDAHRSLLQDAIPVDPVAIQQLGRPGDRDRSHAVIMGTWRLLVEPGRPPRLFDLDADPWEQLDLAGRDPERAAAMLARYAEENSRLASPRALRTDVGRPGGGESIGYGR